MTERFVLFVEPTGGPEALSALADRVELRRIFSPAEADPGDSPAVLLLGSGMDLTAGLAGVPEHVVVIATDEPGARTADIEGRLFVSAEDLRGDAALIRSLRAAARHSASLLSESRSREQLGQVSEQLRELNQIGMALMSERDLDTLLGLILTQARRVTGSDAGSLYLVEEKPDEPRRLHFLRAQNDSLPDLPSPDFTLPLDRSSIAGYVASSGEPLLIEDVYELGAGTPYTFNRSFDETHGYRAKSMLTVPMKDHKDHVVGVLQLINRKRAPSASIHGEADAERHVVPYTQALVEAVSSLAGQAAVSVENGRLYRDIENLFEGFIKAAVTAIDQRDPTTHGHSVRVAALTCAIAEVADKATTGPFKDIHFTKEQMRELRYAGLLHDFGKVGVREEVLVKAKKLPGVLLERVLARFELIRTSLESKFHKRVAEYVLDRGKEGLKEFLEHLEQEFHAELEKVERYQATVLSSNEPRVMQEAGSEALEEIARTTFCNARGEVVRYLDPDELHYLVISQGNLDSAERLQIESHVTHTFNFLQQIPWTEDLARVADIAYAHHEKLNGKGYPRGIGAEDIPLQARMMTVSDIFDALTASDRPYKRALTAERALEILNAEAESAQLDPAVVQALVESKVYERILREDWRDL